MQGRSRSDDEVLLNPTMMPAHTTTHPPTHHTGALPLLGNLTTIATHHGREHDWLLHVSEEVFPGKSWVFTLPFKAAYLVVTDPRVVEHVLKV